MRIKNSKQLLAQGDQYGREIVLNVLEAGLSAADPYENTKKLLQLKENILYVGNEAFEAEDDPKTGIEKIDLNQFKNIWVVGAGKGVQRAALAIEEILGSRLTGGSVTAKYGDDLLLKRIKVTYGSHPIPDRGCMEGSLEICRTAEAVGENDLVFTIFANGGSSLLTLPEEGISLEDVQKITAMLQIEKGVSTVELNVIRNHIDQLKGGKISRLFRKAKQIHLIVTDANHHVIQGPRHNYFGLLKENVWLHNLPEGSTFGQAVEILKKYDAWERCPESIKTFLLKADPKKETVKYEEFIQWNFRVFGIMPDSEHFLPASKRKGEELGIPTVVLTQLLHAEASQCAKVISAIAKNIEEYGEPITAPVILLSSGEMLVSVQGKPGIGGRNQEFALACAKEISGSKGIVIASVDSDGTDGPGGLKLEGAPDCLGGGIVDGETMIIAREKGLDVDGSLAAHDTSKILWELNCGVEIEQNISLNDLTVIFVR